MCGIVGVILKNNIGFFKQSEETFSDLLYADTLRGDDATGVISVEKDGTFHISKEAVPAHYFIPQFMYSQTARTMYQRGKVYIGHNRKATQGKATDDNNAHPFVVAKEFAMVHNGTLTGHRKLAETEVDSEALAIVLAMAFEKEDYLSSLEETLGKVDGAYAVAAYDQRSNKVHLFRNSQRPLAIVEANNGWYFASEPAMLYWIMGRNGFTANDLKVRMVPENTLLTFEMDQYKITTLKEEAYTPKKSTALPIPWTKAGEGTGTKHSFPKSASNETGFSKNSWKRFKRTWLGKRIEFWADDYVEEGGPNGTTVAQGATKVYLMGECDQFKHVNIVNCLVDIKALSIDVSTLDNYLFSGRVDDMEYDTTAEILSIKVDNVHRVLGPARTVIDAKYIQEKLDDEEARKAEEERNSKPSQSTLH